MSALSPQPGEIWVTRSGNPERERTVIRRRGSQIFTEGARRSWSATENFMRTYKLLKSSDESMGVE